MRSRSEDAPLIRALYACFPPSARRRSLFLVLSDNPHYVERLERPARDSYRWGMAKEAEVVEAAGFAALAVGSGFPAADYIDRCHLTEEGGRRLARCVAPKVKELARRLGYLKEEARP